MDFVSLCPTMQRLLQGNRNHTSTNYRTRHHALHSFHHNTRAEVLNGKVIPISIPPPPGIKWRGRVPKVDDMPLEKLMLWGTRREQAGQAACPHLPITPSILRRMPQIWSQEAPQNDHIMLWAACCLGFFSFLRSGEMTAPENEEFDPGQHLSYADISADNPLNPTMLAVKIKQSKTDQFRQGAKVFLGRTDTPLCPVVAMLAYLAWRGSGDGH